MRLHVNFAGSCLERIFIVVMNAHSKRLKAVKMPAITATVVIEKLHDLFTTHRLPETVVTDNGPAIVSREFQYYIAHSGINHIQTARYHSASNELAKRAVQTFIRGELIKNQGIVGAVMIIKISISVFNYSTTYCICSLGIR